MLKTKCDGDDYVATDDDSQKPFLEHEEKKHGASTEVGFKVRIGHACSVFNFRRML